MTKQTLSINVLKGLEKYTDSDVQRETLKAVIEQGSNNKASQHLGKSRRTVDCIINTLYKRYLKSDKKETPIIQFSEPPSGFDINEILRYKKKVFDKKIERKDYEKLINVDIKDDKPIAVCLIGDPHIDDDGCDIYALEDDLQTIAKTEGMFAGHVGDLTNNWVGRLARLYANQVTTAEHAIQLMEWMLNQCPNLFVINGNHDMWNQGADIINFLMRSASGINQSHGARIALNFPSKQVRINARHTFKGHSMYHANQGGIKAQHFGGELDHVYVEGHKHIDGAVLKVHPNQRIAWAFIVSGYKVIDDFADAHGFTEQRINPSLTIVINPKAPNEAELVKPFWDTKSAAQYLTYLRKLY